MDRQIDKIRKRRDFLAAARGRKRAERGLVLQALDRQDGAAPRAGFTVTRKVGNAVIRNRAKRRLRAAAAEILPLAAKPGYDYVLIGRHDTPTRRWAELLADLRAALDEVHGSHTTRPRDRASASRSEASPSDIGKDLPHG
ncbi:MAG: ribonuclease P protein component [Parvibaculum sp.]|uniref:ribonuclease P protein component n=1 Tax=Parvibaculum sp. TaxID=2024848 RepID=UPI0027214E03|nr:ribonuclease P protein component [Parvibaculum sp.]MDO8839097.1 ribonuclease P protein component [Parvibaculum sp.]